METKLTFAKGWCKLWSFLSGLLTDQGGSASSKRVVVYVALLMFVQQVQGSLAGKTINDTIFYGTIATLFATLSLTLPEWFAPKGAMLKGAVIESTSTSTTSDNKTTTTTTDPQKNTI
jgi:hypothetical protein